jgi:type I restriction enzyme S subunit
MSNLGRVSQATLPTDWTVVALGDLLAKLMDFRGRTPKKLGMDWGGGTIPALSANNVRMGFVDFKRECYLGSEELYKAWMVQGDVERHDLVFTMEAPLGNVAVIPDGRKYILSQRVVLLRPNLKVQFQYLFQYLRGDAFAALLDSNSTGTTAKGIQQKRLVQLLVVVPPIAEQKKIAAILTAVDDKLDVISRQIEATQTLKQGLMQTLLSRGVGTQDADGRWVPHTEFRNSVLGEIPVGWECRNLGSLLAEKPEYGANASAVQFDAKNRIRYLRITDIDENGRLRADSIKAIPNDAAQGYLLNDSDLLIARSGNTVGKSILYRNYMGECAFAGYLIRFRFNQSALVEFIAAYLTSDTYWAWVKASVKVGAQPNINAQQYQSMPIPLPPVEEQRRIAEVVASIDAKIGLLKNREYHYQKLKRGLMQKLLTGEWRVKLDSPTSTA